MNSSTSVVFITGGAQGIGLGIAKCFARQNAAIILADANEKQALQAAQQLEAEGAAGVLPLRCDITRGEEVEAAVAQSIERFGRIDVLINNAGICPFVHVMEMTPEMWRRTLEVNLTGAFLCTQAVARTMIERGQNNDGGGRVIFITSLAEDLTQPSQVDYAASKAGLKMAMAGFATALGPHGITCNAIAPGMILTPLTEHHWTQPGPAEQIKTLVPAGRIGTPEDIGNAAVFLASPQASYINGVTLRVDGGFQVLIKG